MNDDSPYEMQLLESLIDHLLIKSYNGQKIFHKETTLAFIKEEIKNLKQKTKE